MPTGYTADIYEGNNPNLKDFLSRMARGMVLYIMQRDEDNDTGLKARKVSEYQVRYAKEAEEALAAIQAMTPEQKQAGFEKAKAQAEESFLESVKKSKEMAERYDRYIDAVERIHWPIDPKFQEPGDDEVLKFFAGYRKFVREQLSSSRDFDVSEPKRWFNYQDADDWYADQLVAASKSYEYATQSLAEEISRVATQNIVHQRLTQWLEGLDYVP